MKATNRKGSTHFFGLFSPKDQKDEARKAAEALSEEIGVEILPFEEMVYLPFEDEFRSINQVPDHTHIYRGQTYTIHKSDLYMIFDHHSILLLYQHVDLWPDNYA